MSLTRQLQRKRKEIKAQYSHNLTRQQLREKRAIQNKIAQINELINSAYESHRTESLQNLLKAHQSLSVMLNTIERRAVLNGGIEA